VANDSGARDRYPGEFLAAVTRVLDDEGGYCANPADSGGATKFGISSREYPDLDVAALTRDDAIAIYYRDYWMRVGLDRLPPAIAAKTFDLAVNIGAGAAVRCLQRALRACGRRVAEDGVLGAATAAAASSADLSALLAALRSEAAGYYRTLAALERGRRPGSDREFLDGWLNRAYA
jgi:lysozyme family protein